MSLEPQHTIVRETANVTILRPTRNLVGDQETAELEALMAELNDRGVRNLILDLAGVEFLNTTGLMAIVGAYIRFSKRSARICICGMQNRVRSVFNAAQFGLLIPTYDSEEEAIASCTRSR